MLCVINLKKDRINDFEKAEKPLHFTGEKTNCKKWTKKIHNTTDYEDQLNPNGI